MCTARLSHPNIVITYKYDINRLETRGMPGGRLSTAWQVVILQEFCRGGTLGTLLDSGLGTCSSSSGGGSVDKHASSAFPSGLILVSYFSWVGILNPVTLAKP